GAAVVVRRDAGADERAIVYEDANFVVVRRDVRRPEPPVSLDAPVRDAAHGGVLQDYPPLVVGDPHLASVDVETAARVELPSKRGEPIAADDRSGPDDRAAAVEKGTHHDAVRHRVTVHLECRAVAQQNAAAASVQPGSLAHAAAASVKHAPAASSPPQSRSACRTPT